MRRRLTCGGAAAAVALAAAVASGSPRALAAPQETRLVVAAPSGNEAYRLAEIVSGPLGDALGRPVVIDQVGGGDDIAAARAVLEAAPDGGTLLLANNLRLAVNEATGRWPLSLDALRPVAKLTLGISVALVGRADAGMTGWPALLDRADTGGLRLSVPSGHAAYDVARAMLEGETGMSFEVVETADDRASLSDVAQGRADIGLVTTNSIAMSDAAAGVQPIVTFGAKRSPGHPDTPTFAELTGDDKNDFTYSYALFGPPELPEGLAGELAAAVQTACAHPQTLSAAGARALPLACHDAEVVRETVARDLRVARRAFPD